MLECMSGCAKQYQGVLLKRNGQKLRQHHQQIRVSVLNFLLHNLIAVKFLKRLYTYNML